MVRMACTTRGSKPRNVAGYFLIGLVNNIGFVIMIAGAKNIAEAGVALVYLANVVPTTLVKVTAPLWFDLLSYNVRLVTSALIMASSFLCVALTDSVGLQLLGVALGSFSCGLGEASFLAMAYYFDSATMLAAWSSGTGLAGILGYLWVITINVWLGASFEVTILAALVWPVFWVVVYFALMDLPEPLLTWVVCGRVVGGPDSRNCPGRSYVPLAGDGRQEAAPERHGGGGGKGTLRASTLHYEGEGQVQSAAAAAGVVERAAPIEEDAPFQRDNAMVDYGAVNGTGGDGRSAWHTGSGRAPMTLKGDTSNTHNDGGHTNHVGDDNNHISNTSSSNSNGNGNGNDDDDDDDDAKGGGSNARERLTCATRLRAFRTLWRFMIPLFVVYFAEYAMQSGAWSAIGFPVNDEASRKHFYLQANLAYQVGVFVSRSSAFFVKGSLAAVWVAPFLQVALLIFFVADAASHFLYVQWALVVLGFVTGLFGGFVYVNAFTLIAERVEDNVREFSLTTASMGDSFGIIASDICSLFLQACLYDVNGIVDNSTGSAHVQCPFNLNATTPGNWSTGALLRSR